jgi:ribosomal protein S18 acetylase RimI-like enzyme
VARSRVRVRAATTLDADAVFALVEQLDGYSPDRSSFDQGFGEAMERPGSQALFVAEEAGGKVVGYAMVTITRLLYTRGDAAQIQELAVDAGSRGSGVGSQLVAAVEKECRSRGVRELTVASSRGADFYTRLNYRSTADYLKKTFD